MRRSHSRALASIAAAVCAGLNGCVLGVPGVHDINIVAVEVVNDDITVRRPGRVIKVTFSSRRNLFQYSHDYNWLLSGRFYFCDNRRLKEPSFDASAVFWNGLDVESDRRNDYHKIVESLQKSATQFYQTALRIRYPRRSDDIRPDTPMSAVYDLERDPQDVCYRLSGGSLWGHFHSNIALIPKETIMLAFERARSRSNN
jgi:hypothetical protein